MGTDLVEVVLELAGPGRLQESPERIAEEPGLEPKYDVVWPKAPRGVQARPAATRPATLNGARIGFVWDYMFRGDELFPVLETELRRRFPGVEIVGHEHFGNIHGPHEAALVEALPGTLDEHGIDAVVVGNGC